MPILTRLRHLRAWQTCVVIGSAATVLYLLLPTQQYSGDGMRWYPMIAAAAPLRLGGTTHLLYPPLARLYFYLAHDALGFPASFATAQSLNAWFGGAGIACFAYILFCFARRWPLVIAGAAVLACSRAYSLHATDMTEPMPGTFLALLAIAFTAAYVTRPNSGRWLVTAAGTSIGLAAPIYQSNVLALISVGAILFLCKPDAPRRQRLVDLLLCALVAGTVALGSYVIALLVSGSARTLGEAVAQSLTTENEATQGVYAEVSLRRMGVLIFGLGDAVFGLRAIGGQSGLFFSSGLTSEVAWTIGLVGWSAGIIVLIVMPYVFRRVRLSGMDRRVVAAVLIGLFPQLLLLVYWGARYSKLWISPLTLILIGLVVLVHAAQMQAVHVSRFTQTVFWAGLFAPVLVAGVWFNMLSDHVTPNPGMQDTLDIAARVGPRDLIISDWGGAPYPVPSQPHTMSLIGAAFDAKLNTHAVRARIQREIEAAALRGGAVYFYGLLDLTETEWNIFLGQRIQLPFTFLDEYRRSAAPTLLLRLRTTLGQPLRLWKLENP